MRNKLIPALIGIVIISGTWGVAYWQESHEESTASPREEQMIPNTSYPLSEIALHNSAGDCWAAINGGVYDLTSWIPRHPGGERAIESLCGKDGSAAFNTQHGGGVAQEAILLGLKIGVVGQ